MRVEIVLALVMLFSFFVLEWFEAGPLISIRGYNVVSTLSRIREAFNGSSDNSGLFIYYGLYIIPLTSLIGILLSYKGNRVEAFNTISAGGTVALLIMFLQAVVSKFELVKAFGPGAWLAIVATIVTWFMADDFKKKLASAKDPGTDRDENSPGKVR